MLRVASSTPELSAIRKLSINAVGGSMGCVCPSLLMLLSDLFENESGCFYSIRHELRIRTSLEDDVSAFPRFVIDQAPFVS